MTMFARHDEGNQLLMTWPQPVPSFTPSLNPFVNHPFVSTKASSGAQSSNASRCLNLSGPLSSPHGTYTFGKEIGRGSYGVVVECTHRQMGQRFACKIVSKARLKSVLERQVLTQEIALMRALAGHPGIVRLEGVYEDASDVFMVMEYCNGGELYQKIFHEGKMPEPLAARVFRQLSDAVRYCHARGVMHRDLKPENVLLHYPNRADGTAAGAGRNVLAASGAARSEAMAAIQVKLADFGLGLVLPPGVFATVCVGSLMYEAPEVVLGERYNHQADVWSLGVILYVLLSGGLPFMDKDDRRLARKICEGRYEMRFSPWPFVSDDAKSLVRRLLVVDPNRRSSVEDFINHPWLVAHCGPAAPIVLDGSEVPLPRTPSALWRADAGSVSAAIRAALPNASAAAAAAAAAASNAASSAAAAAAAAASQLKSDVWGPMGRLPAVNLGRGAWGVGSGAGSSAGGSSESGSSAPSATPSSSVTAAVAAAVARRNGAADDSNTEAAEAAPRDTSAAPVAPADASPSARILMTSLSEPVTEGPSSPSSSYASARSNSWVEPAATAADGEMDGGLDLPPAGPRRRMWRMWRMRWMKRGWRFGLQTGARGAEKLEAGGEGAGARLPRTRANVFGACFGCFFAPQADFETSADRLWAVEDEAGRPVTAARDAGGVTNGLDNNGGGAVEGGEMAGQRRAGEGGERGAVKRAAKTPKAYQRLAMSEEGGEGAEWGGADGEGGEEAGGVQVRCRGGRIGEKGKWMALRATET
ncbi:hypothetical protein CLOM_g17885 [Closterium sp. NIES-68]|nr:hypothetical protein CLOM_g17885 [Closterium sp. NIES-68]GJP74003.1 hypothetical protein CLOP_g4656 [Closterium sp. NIES-67]